MSIDPYKGRQGKRHRDSEAEKVRQKERDSGREVEGERVRDRGRFIYI